MPEYKSKYLNQTGNEITTSFDGVNCKTINCRITHHKNHYDLQCLQLAKMYLNLFAKQGNVINSYIEHYKINDLLDLVTDGYKIQQIDKKINQIKQKIQNNIN